MTLPIPFGSTQKELKQLKRNKKKSNSRWYWSVLKGLGYAVSLLAGMAVGLLILLL